MANLEDLIEETLLNIEGYIGDQDIYGTVMLPTPAYSKTTTAWTADTTTVIADGAYGLDNKTGGYKRGKGVAKWAALSFIAGWNSTTGIDATANEILVAGPVFQTGSGFSTGIIEVGDELIYVQDIDSTTGLFSSVLRGWRGTTASTWPAGTRIRNNPRFPIISVKRAINDTIKSLYPKVFSVKTTELTVNGFTKQYDIPANAINILQVSYKKPGSSDTWLPVNKWNFENRAGSNSSTGRVVNIYNAPAGYPVQITYIVEPNTLEIGDEYSSVTGLPDWTREVVIFGACWRLMSFMDAGRMSNTTAEQSLISANRYDNASGTNLSKYFLGIYQQRLVEAEQRQKAEFTPQRHQLR